MYAVIFKAEVQELDDAYQTMANHLRELALSHYGCTEFIATTEGNNEVAISYWPSLEQIRAWRNDPEHQQAQVLGKSRWYRSYQVQVVEIVKDYSSTA